MGKRGVCVFNQTRQSFLSLDTKVANSQFTRLKGLLGKREFKSNHGLWLVPCQGIHTIGLFFPIDVVYLDANNRVVHLIEHLKPFRVTSIRRGCQSVLELPVRTIYVSETEVGDQITLSTVAEWDERASASPETERELATSEFRDMVGPEVPSAVEPRSLVSAPGTEEGLRARQHTEIGWGKSGYSHTTKPDGPF